LGWNLYLEKNGRKIDDIRIGSYGGVHRLAEERGIDLVDTAFKLLSEEEMATEAGCYYEAFKPSTLRRIQKAYKELANGIEQKNKQVIARLNAGEIDDEHSDETWGYSVALTIAKLAHKARITEGRLVFA